MSVCETTLERRLLEIVGEGGLLTEASDRAAYEQGWRYGRGVARCVVRPRTTAEVSAVLALCHETGTRVQPIGANTGLVGASNPDATGEQVVLSLERLSRTIDVDVRNRSVTVDAGVTLSALNAALEPHGLFFPVDLGADPQIGGMVVTNTGGTRLLRYGSVRDNLLGLEVVLADGRIASELSRLRKDNRGLDWKQLFCGTSGVFGVVTRAVLSLERLPRQRVTAWVAVESGEGALALLEHLESELAGLVSAFEVLSGEAFRATLDHGANVVNPFGTDRPELACLVELSTALAPGVLPLEANLFESLEAFLAVHSEHASDAVPLEPAVAWELRHQVSESLRHEGDVLGLDVSVPRSRLPEFLTAIRAELAAQHPDVRVCDFGHWGDGGCHLNLVLPAGSSSARRDTLQHRIYERCAEEFEGSFSAEHGVGPHNQDEYLARAAELQLAVSRALKRELDPRALLARIPHQLPT